VGPTEWHSHPVLAVTNSILSKRIPPEHAMFYLIPCAGSD